MRPCLVLLARWWPVVSWFMEIMAELGCCPPSSSIENRSSGTEHMLVRVRTCAVTSYTGVCRVHMHYNIVSILPQVKSFISPL